MTIYSESGTRLPTGMNNINDNIEYPNITLRAPPGSPSSEDQCDTITNGTASNEDSSSDEAPRRNSGQSFTRMNDESNDEDTGVISRVSFTQWLQKNNQNVQNYLAHWIVFWFYADP